MIRRIRGTLVDRSPESVEVVAGDGLGYDVQVPLTLLDRLPGVGEEIELHTTLVVRDDALELYGFESPRDRELFRRLRTASGVGPRLALAILGTLPSDRVIQAIRARDHAALQTVSGVGKKTAERIALELADKLDDLGSGAPGLAGPDAASAAAVRALRALGYGQLESDNAVRRALETLDARAEAEALIKEALQWV
ncbi:MAG: Holliday junction branch migration protein RuvA [Gemmatimonadota bacterium]|nr:Holliday junction branch migration protein RuvA [Gemmatimonadota bacterium]